MFFGLYIYFVMAGALLVGTLIWLAIAVVAGYKVIQKVKEESS